jgi:hypothetical protein
VGSAVEREVTRRTLSYEQARRADDESSLVVGHTTLRISKLASSAVARRNRREKIDRSLNLIVDC